MLATGVVALFAACSSAAEGGSELAVCASGQVSGCVCPGGTPPLGQNGCSPASGGDTASGATAGQVGTAGRAVVAGGGGPTSAAGSGAPSATAAGSGAPIAPIATAADSGTGGTGGTGTSASGAGMNAPAASAGAGTNAPAADGGGIAACAGGTRGKASNGGGVSGRGNGNVQFQVAADNQILRMRTTLEVPGKPNGTTTLFLWPGLEPIRGSEHYDPIGTGVLQPVLTWGGSCAPGSIQTRQGSNWWISSQYVNTLGSHQGHRGCYGGDTMDVESGDLLDIDMRLDGTVWTQTVTSQKTGMSVDFDMDLEMQEQRWALFEIEMPTNTRPAEDVVFTNTVIELQKPEPESCKGTTRGADDYFSAPIASADGTRCCVERIVLRLAGATPTTPDPAP